MNPSPLIKQLSSLSKLWIYMFLKTPLSVVLVSWISCVAPCVGGVLELFVCSWESLYTKHPHHRRMVQKSFWKIRGETS